MLILVKFLITNVVSLLLYICLYLYLDRGLYATQKQKGLSLLYTYSQLKIAPIYCALKTLVVHKCMIIFVLVDKEKHVSIFLKENISGAL